MTATILSSEAPIDGKGKNPDLKCEWNPFSERDLRANGGQIGQVYRNIVADKTKMETVGRRKSDELSINGSMRFERWNEEEYEVWIFGVDNSIVKQANIGVGCKFWICLVNALLLRERS